MFERRKIEKPWEGQVKPFKILGNLYFCGCHQASSHLIDTGEGLILVDTGYENNLYLLVHSIHSLGFKPEEIRYIIHTHWHDDHTGATAGMVGISGAKTLIGEEDAEKARDYFEPDILIKDGDRLTLGNTTIEFMATPGHTKGTMSLFFDLQAEGKTYRAGMFGGAGANTLAKGTFEYSACREDYRSSVARLKKEHVDVFFGNHVWNNDTEKKGKILLETGENQFIDSQIWHTFLDYCIRRLEQRIAED